MTTEDSDRDIVGICIPNKDDIFPHLKNEIVGFGKEKQRFNEWILHHVEDKDNKTNYDFTIYSIVKYFNLAMQNNPNTLEILYAPQNCVLHCTQVGNMIRENRKMFLHKGSKFKYLGYSYSQFNKAKSQTRVGKRKDVVDTYGYDLKFMSHCIRLLDQGLQILEEGDLDPQREREKLKSIRRGEWSFEQVQEYFNMKEKQVEEAYTKSSLPNCPDEEKIKSLLLNCLEHHFGKLDEKVISKVGEAEKKLEEIRNILEK
ncbi:nucleotidyltransferase domain-containing protein [Candidatus Gracilibacteria bacterium]|nr:nucleotidyltransferase domain-containing protein [Candidatus Gracilibacteria bacterium]